jgi:sulfur-carrier protein
VQVELNGPLRSGAGGAASVDIEAANIRELLERLVERFPDMQAHLDQGIAVAINGEIFRDDWTRSIPPGAEVVLLPRIVGG